MKNVSMSSHQQPMHKLQMPTPINENIITLYFFSDFTIIHHFCYYYHNSYPCTRYICQCSNGWITWACTPFLLVSLEKYLSYFKLVSSPNYLMLLNMSNYCWHGIPPHSSSVFLPSTIKIAQKAMIICRTKFHWYKGQWLTTKLKT
jgi:hypothetical protein